MLGRRTVVAALAASATLTAAPAAQALPVTVERAVERTCQARLLPAGTPGVARETVAPKAAGVTTARLTGSAGDWDLALFDAKTGRLHNAGATAGRSEQAVALAPANRAIVAQACRRTGSGASAELKIGFYQPPAPAAEREPPAIVHVPLGAGRTIAQLEATGLDVTHAVDASGADVVLYSAAERTRLLAAGFTYRTVVPDLRKADFASFRADRAYAGSIRASALPSGRDSYRTLADYGTDLKGIVDKYPAVARRVEIGKSLEGRPIEGVELGGNVGGRDGRPIFAVLGAHHAREWPS
ncbi:MAG TPA: M14 family zinc carboxypeptidase, partial [Thermoleophilaceae bacterium]